MPPKKQIIKKTYVVDDLPKVRKGAGGIYCILPYERLDKNGNALYKVGLAISIKSRIEEYHTYYPLGVYFKNLLSDPIKERDAFYYKDTEDRNKRKFNNKKYLLAIEKYVQERIIEHGGKRLYTTTRVKNPIEDAVGNIKGESEWFFGNTEVFTLAFAEAQYKFGGSNYSVDLDDINTLAEANKKNGFDYHAEVYYKL